MLKEERLDYILRKLKTDQKVLQTEREHGPPGV